MRTKETRVRSERWERAVAILVSMVWLMSSSSASVPTVRLDGPGDGMLDVFFLVSWSSFGGAGAGVGTGEVAAMSFHLVLDSAHSPCASWH